MLKFGNKEFRNLQEQVLKNMQNIANIKEGTAVLSEFGIKVVGEVDSIQDLPTVADYKTAHEDWEYGDAFAIGTEPPYKLVILTRANDEITADHWFDIGDFPAPGPQGERGPQGEQGVQGQTGDTGPAGNDAGFGTILASAQTLSAGSSATATVTASGPNTAKEFSFVFGIPRGADGGNPVWGNIQGTLADQTDLKNALDDKQDELVSGTNIKTINNQSVVGSGNIEINSGVWGNITGTLSNQTDLANALSAKQDVIDSSHKLPAANVSGLATVATSGSYDDLSNKPSIPAAQVNSDWNAASGVAQILNKPSLATVATSGSYNDLTNKPSIPAAQIQSDYAQSNSSAVDYIKNKPDLSIYAQSANLATVATSGSYNDLINKPSIPAAQVQSDYAQSDNTQVDYIKNKPDLSVYALSSSLATVATSGDYDDLIDKPTIGDATLTIQKNGTTVDTFTANATSDKTINITVPTNSDYVDLTSAQIITGTKTFHYTIPNTDKDHDIIINPVTNKISVIYTDGTNSSTVIGDASIKILAGDTGEESETDIYTGRIDLKSYDDNENTTYNLIIGTTGVSKQVGSAAATRFLWPTASGSLALTSDLANYVTINTAQTITGVKTFVGDTTTEPLVVNYHGDDTDAIKFVDLDSNNYIGSINTDGIRRGNIFIYYPSSSGTLALTSDIPSLTNYVTTNTTQTITGEKILNIQNTTTYNNVGYQNRLRINKNENINDYYLQFRTQASGVVNSSKLDAFNGLVVNDTAAYQSTYKAGEILNKPASGSEVALTLPTTAGTLALTSQIPSVPVTDVTVGGTSVVSSGTAVIPAIPSVSSTSETWTFTLSDGTTTTKTIVTSVTVS